MEKKEIIIILKRLYKEHVSKYLNKILLALVLSVVVAASTSATAWLLDPAVKKIFIDQDQTLAWLIPIGIVFAFSSKGLSLYLARIYVTGKDINRIMVSNGMAWVYDAYVRNKSFYKDQELAQIQQLGVWSLGDAIPPWTWRRNR